MFIMNFSIILLHAAHTLVFKRAFRAKQLCQSAHTLSNPFPRLHNPFHIRPCYLRENGRVVLCSAAQPEQSFQTLPHDERKSAALI